MGFSNCGETQVQTRATKLPTPAPTISPTTAPTAVTTTTTGATTTTAVGEAAVIGSTEAGSRGRCFSTVVFVSSVVCVFIVGVVIGVAVIPSKKATSAGPVAVKQVEATLSSNSRSGQPGQV